MNRGFTIGIDDATGTAGDGDLMDLGTGDRPIQGHPAPPWLDPIYMLMLSWILDVDVDVTWDI